MKINKYCVECNSELIKTNEVVKISKNLKYCDYKCPKCGRFIFEVPEELTRAEYEEACKETNPETQRAIEENVKYIEDPASKIFSRAYSRRQVNLNTCDHENGEYDRDGDFNCDDCDQLIYVENKKINKDELNTEDLYRKAIEKMSELVESDDEEYDHREADIVLTDFLRDLGYDKLVYLFKKVDKYYA